MLRRRGGERQDRGGALGGDGEDLRRAGCDTFARLEGVEIGREQVEIALADAFGEHDAVRLALHDDREIAQRQAGVERIHANVELRPGAIGERR